MESIAPFIINACIMVTYCTAAVFCYFKYRGYLDAFMKTNIRIYVCAFIAKPCYWLACYLLYLHYQTDVQNKRPSFINPIRDSLGSLMSGICFFNHSRDFLSNNDCILPAQELRRFIKAVISRPKMHNDYVYSLCYLHCDHHFIICH